MGNLGKKNLMLSIFLFLSTAFLLHPSFAEAYLDPATGGHILQMLLAAGMTVLFTINLYYQKIKSFFKNLLKKAKDKNEPDIE